MTEDWAPELTATPNNEGVDAAVSAARRVIDALLHAGDSTAAEMQQVTEQLNEVAEYLESHVPPLDERLVNMWAGEGVTRHDPITGPENAIAPPLPLQGNEDRSISGETTLGLPYQGPPGYVHGGVSAMLLDHTLGVANHWAGASGVTARLTLTYLRPTPLFTPLTVIGQQMRVDGRKIWTEGRIVVDGEPTVTAEGLFIAKELPRPR